MKKFAWSNKKHSDNLENGVLRYLHRERLTYILRQLEDTISTSPSWRCLDLGCGDGIFMKHFLSGGLEKFIGCDADYNRLLRARECCQKREVFINALAENTPFADQSFDLVVLHHVLEHIKNEKDVLAECRRLLKPGGLLIIGVPNEDSINGRVLRVLHPKMYEQGEHVNFYSERKLIELLRSFNFNPIKIRRVGFLFPQYYIHIFLISNRVTFLIGDFLTRILKFSADSLILICCLE